jgi:hypothetical protein
MRDEREQPGDGPREPLDLQHADAGAVVEIREGDALQMRLG